MHEAARTLVKSPPELWAEVSDPQSLARHLGEVGEIRITRLDPESTVVWEGDRIRGTVDLAPAGWGTKVTVTAEEMAAAEPPADAPEPQAAEPDPAPEPPPAVEAEAAAAVAEPTTDADEPEAAGPRGLRRLIARLFGRKPAPAVEAPAVEEEPATTVAEEPAVEEEPATTVAEEPAVEDEPAPAEARSFDADALLDEMLGSLGSAHHRPFSR